MNRSHYVVYWDNNTNSFVTTTPRDWARDFGARHGIDGDARTAAIEDYLKSQFRFVEFTNDTSVVLFQFNTTTPDFD